MEKKAILTVISDNALLLGTIATITMEMRHVTQKSAQSVQYLRKVPISSPLTHMVYLVPFLSYLAGSKGISVRPPVRPGQDHKYSSRSYRFVERHEGLIARNIKKVSIPKDMEMKIGLF